MSNLLYSVWKGWKRRRRFRATVYERDDGIHAWVNLNDEDRLELVFKHDAFNVEIPRGPDVEIAILVEQTVLGFLARTYWLEKERRPPPWLRGFRYTQNRH